LSSSFFFKDEGKLILGTNKMHEWKLRVDNDVMIEVQKQDVIAQDYIKGTNLTIKAPRSAVTAQDSAKGWEGRV
jgi:hypothetical protein